MRPLPMGSNSAERMSHDEGATNSPRSVATRSTHTAEGACVVRQALSRSQLLRTQGVWLPEAGFLRRRAYFCDKERGVFNDPNVSKSEKDPLAMMQDPNMMMQQQKSMFTVMLPQMVMMGLISFFFSGSYSALPPLKHTHLHPARPTARTQRRAGRLRVQRGGLPGGA